MLAEVTRTTHGVPDIVCVILLIATLIALVVGLAQALGFTVLRTVDRFSPLVIGVILLIVYVVLC